MWGHSGAPAPAHREGDPCSGAANRQHGPVAAEQSVPAAVEASLAAATYAAEAPARGEEVARGEVRSFGPRRGQEALCLSLGR